MVGMDRLSLSRRMEGRTCEALLVHEAYRGEQLLEGVVQLALRFGPRAWARFFFAGGGCSWAEYTEAPPDPSDPRGDLRFVRVDVAEMLALGGHRITFAELAPRDGEAARLTLGFDTGALLTVEHDGQASRLRLIPPAA
jgi:hypothetical protein